MKINPPAGALPPPPDASSGTVAPHSASTSPASSPRNRPYVGTRAGSSAPRSTIADAFTEPATNVPLATPLVMSRAAEMDKQRRATAQIDAAIDAWVATQETILQVPDAAAAIASSLKTLIHRRSCDISDFDDASAKSLTIAGANLNSFPIEMGQAETLEVLDLTENNLTSFPMKAGQYKSLETLRLTDNALTSFPAGMSQSTALLVLELDGNKLTEFPGVMKNVGTLARLSLARNALRYFPAEMGEAKALEVLNLSDNHLEEFPREMGQAKSLMSLDLSINKLKELPIEIGQLQNLSFLNLSDNFFIEIPDAVCQAQLLRNLDMSLNELTALPESMVSLETLRYLDLSANRFDNMPAMLGRAASLIDLNLRANRLSDLPVEMAQLPALTSLDLTANRFSAVPAVLYQAESLAYLNLSLNQLTSVPSEMMQLIKLRFLNLAGNRITDIPAAIGHARSLQNLDLSANQLTSLPAQIIQLQRLQFLDLTRNHFTEIPRALLVLPEETEIDLRNNPLPEAEIEAVRAEMQARRDAGLSVPHIILPRLAAEADDFREAAINGMNVHEPVLNETFTRRLDVLASHFPTQLAGDVGQQRVQMAKIRLRVIQAIDAHVSNGISSVEVCDQARSTANLMFQKGQGTRTAFHNDFQYSAGHVLAYTYLAIEDQLARTPDAHRDEATLQAMALLMQALQNGNGNCDTRLCQEVLQVVGIPFSTYAETHLEVIRIAPVALNDQAGHDQAFTEAKTLLHELLDTGAAVSGTVMSVAWSNALVQRMQADHPLVTAEQTERCMEEIKSNWETFYGIVAEERDDNAEANVRA